MPEIFKKAVNSEFLVVFFIFKKIIASLKKAVKLIICE